MNTFLTKAFIFVAGAAVGAAASWKILEAHFKRITQEEIDSVKEYYSNKPNRTTDEDNVEEKDKNVEIETEKETTEPDTFSHRKYADILAQRGYTDYSRMATEEKETPPTEEEPESSDEGPYVISPIEFGQREDYDTISLTYYADGVVADDMDCRLLDVDDVIGIDSLNHFGDYEEDCVYVRNDEYKADYEILADVRRYADIVPGTSRRSTEV